MKKQFLLFVAAMVVGATSLLAQATPQKLSREERTKSTMQKFAAFDLTKENSNKIEIIFQDFYQAQETLMQEMRTSGASREDMMAKRKKLMEERNTKLKAVLTKDQFDKFESEIEPSLRPQRMQAPPTAPTDKQAAPAEKKPAPAN